MKIGEDINHIPTVNDANSHVQNSFI